MAKPILTTNRLCLRKMDLDDFDDLMEIFTDPVVMKYYNATKNGQKTQEWIRWNQSNYARHGSGLWIVEDKSSGSFLGQCGIVPQEVDGFLETGLGYLFKRSAWGHGYATEAAQACVDYAFTELNKRKVIAVIDVHNAPSIKVAERVGMKRTKSTVKWGKRVDVYSVLK